MEDKIKQRYLPKQSAHLATTVIAHHPFDSSLDVSIIRLYHTVLVWANRLPIPRVSSRNIQSIINSCKYWHNSEHCQLCHVKGLFRLRRLFSLLVSPVYEQQVHHFQLLYGKTDFTISVFDLLLELL